MMVAASVILVDQTAVPLATPHIIQSLGGSISSGQWILTANLVPLAAFLVVGGHFGDVFGLRRVFLAGAVGFLAATVLAAASQDMAMLIAARLVQGTSAALMMPNSIAIVSASFPVEQRGSVLGTLAGGTAFLAALGPVVGGSLTGISWRLIFVLNGLLTLCCIAMTLRSTPRLPGRASSRLDLPGLALFTIGISGIVFGVGELSQTGVSTAAQLVPLVLGCLALASFVPVELRVRSPLVDIRLLRHLNYLAANLSQLLAGAVELGLGYLLPFELLLVVGVTPAIAGLALLPASIPIVLVGPLSGRAFDRYGGRWPLVIGFLVLALSGVGLALGVSHQSVIALIPGLVLQGVGLGIVLTVSDPAGLASIPDESMGQAAGLIITAEQLGGAIGIAGFLALEYRHFITDLYARLAQRGIRPTAAQVEISRQYILRAEQTGIHHLAQPAVVRTVFRDITLAHVDGFRLAFGASAGVALLGAAICLVLVRRGDPIGMPIRSRRTRWGLAASRDPALLATRIDHAQPSVTPAMIDDDGRLDGCVSERDAAQPGP